MSGHDGCVCRRCRRLPRPKVIGYAHAVAVVLHLDIDSAWDLAHLFPVGDLGHRELVDAIVAWEAERDVA